jgi:hypothetical protein
VLAALKAHIEGRYGIPVHFTEVPAPFIGDLDGAEIRLKPNEDLGLTVFNLAHLFGHTVQWNTDETARQIGLDAAVIGRASEQDVARLRRYEEEASRYSLQLLHEIGARDLDQWFSDIAASDLDYLAHFYRTGERRDPREFWQDGRPLLTPLRVPPFVPTRSKFRWDGIVI